MLHDGKLNIAEGHAANSKIWKNKTIFWSDFVSRISDVSRMRVTFKEFINAKREDQTVLKGASGGYVGGYLRGGKRSPKNVVHRQLLTLDIDFGGLDIWEDITLLYANAAILHGTAKHEKESPRYRLLMPLDRECTPDEYVAVARQVAGSIGIDLFDQTTFETNRLMFYPVSPKDVDFYIEIQDGPWLKVDEVLNTYLDWRDTSLWPSVKKNLKELSEDFKKLEDPHTKKGVIGTFCRAYTIQDAIDTFLVDHYVPAAQGRYTYLKGSTSAGLIIYEDKFAFSHHGTDPIAGMTCNAFDLVRIHLFGHLDQNALGDSDRNKSFQKMLLLAQEDKNVKKLIAAETINSSRFDFEDEYEEETEENGEVTKKKVKKDLSWMDKLESDTKNTYVSTAPNISTILENDSNIKGLFKKNTFDEKIYVTRKPPWRDKGDFETIKNVDFSGLRNYVESIYKISSPGKIEDAFLIEAAKQEYHPVRDYLKAQVWDGKKRVDTLLMDYFGVRDNLYTREAIRKMLVGAVARVFRPGIKFDLVLTLVGKQGTYKSTFLKILGREWFSDTMPTIQGKDGMEQVQGVWIIELAELAATRKAEVEAIKHFISKQEDNFRAAYARTPEVYKRQCVFFGTTNEEEFLTDPTGNRRFMPVTLDEIPRTKSIIDDLENEVGQVWAEAYQMFLKKEPLHLSPEAEKIAKVERESYVEEDDRKGLIENYLNTPLPEKWPEMDLLERRIFLADPIAEKGTVFREYVCSAEIWCECLGKDKDSMTRYNTKEIRNILKGLPDWESFNFSRRFPIYGPQKGYKLKNYEEEPPSLL